MANLGLLTLAAANLSCDSKHTPAPIEPTQEKELVALLKTILQESRNVRLTPPQRCLIPSSEVMEFVATLAHGIFELHVVKGISDVRPESLKDKLTGKIPTPDEKRKELWEKISAFVSASDTTSAAFKSLISAPYSQERFYKVFWLHIPNFLIQYGIFSIPYNGIFKPKDRADTVLEIHPSYIFVERIGAEQLEVSGNSSITVPVFKYNKPVSIDGQSLCLIDPSQFNGMASFGSVFLSENYDANAANINDVCQRNIPPWGDTTHVDYLSNFTHAGARLQFDKFVIVLFSMDLL